MMMTEEERGEEGNIILNKIIWLQVLTCSFFIVSFLPC